MKVYRNSLNLFNSDWEQGTINYQTGIDDDNANVVRTKEYLTVEYNQVYSISRNVTTGLIGLRLYTSDHTYLGVGSNTRIRLIAGQNTSSPMGANDSFCCFQIIDSSVAYIRIIDNSNDLSTLYMMIAQQVTESEMIPYEPYNVVDWYGYTYKLRASGAWTAGAEKKRSGGAWV